MRVQPLREDAVPTIAVVEPALDATPRAAIGEVLCAGGAVSAAAIAEALATQNGVRLGEHLIRTGVVSEDIVAWAVAQQYGLPYIDLTKDPAQPDAAAMITADASHAFQILPVRVHASGTLDVVVADPTDDLVRRVLESLPVRRVRIGMAPPSQLRAAIDRAFPGGSTPRAVNDDRRVRRVLEHILRQAANDRASDVHLEPADDHMRVRFRVDGVLRESLVLLADVARPLLDHIKHIATSDDAEPRQLHGGRFRYGVGGHEIDVRVSIVPTMGGEHCVLHLRDRDNGRVMLHDLGMTAGVRALYTELAQSPSGMIIVSGPARSGRTTTQYATLDAIDHNYLSVMAVEDRIDFVVPGINQFRVDLDAGVTFATMLEAIARQDPDVLVVGEMPDIEAAQHAVRAAITGHLVVASLHAMDTVDAVWRLLDLGLERRIVASSVIAVVNQRLVRRICPSCAVPFLPAPRELAFYTRRGGSAGDVFVHGTGCDVCAGTGYHGRAAAFEVLPVTDEVVRELLAGANAARIREIALSEGMHPLMQHAVQLVAGQVTTIDEVRRAL